MASSEAQVARVLVLGAGGSGKSRLAEALAARWRLPYVPAYRALRTQDGAPRPHAELQAWIEGEVARDAWVIDGNFEDERDRVWARAELAIWLDLPAWVTVVRVLRRELRRLQARRRSGRASNGAALLWAGVRHAWRSSADKRRAFPAMLAAFPRLRVVRLTSDGAVARWLAAQKHRRG